jgi:UDP-glucose 4-epimerase
MKIAVSGGNGRVGQAVVSLALQQGHAVVSIDRTVAKRDDGAHLLQLTADLTDYAAYEQAISGCDALIHLAAIPHPHQAADHEVHNNNVVGSYNAMSAAARLGIRRVCLASSINALGGIFSRWPHYDYLPLDEEHPTYNEDPYSLSKWIAEQQADMFARRYEWMTIASLRMHGVTPDHVVRKRPLQELNAMMAKQLWGFTRISAVARACLLAITADFTGHERFYVVSPVTVMDVPSRDLKQLYYPTVPLRGELVGNQSFYQCAKAERLLGWKHDEEEM